MSDVKPCVYIVDDDAAIRAALRRLAEEVGLNCATFSDGNEFLDAYNPGQPGCLVLDVRMPGISGIELHKRLVADDIDLPVILVSGYGDIPMATDALRRGAVDFLEKPVSPQLLLDRVQQALETDSQRRRERAEIDAIQQRVDTLTPREREVVDLAITGLTNKEIAARLGVSPQAIDAHRARALRRMGVNTVPELVRDMLKYAEHNRGSTHHNLGV